jgi:hypothetical protein
MAEVLRYAEPGRRIWDQHRGILNAIVRGDAEAAMERAAGHVTGAAEQLSGAFRDGRINGGSAAADNRAGRTPGVRRTQGARML